MSKLRVSTLFLLMMTTVSRAQTGNDAVHFVGNYIEVIGLGRPPDSDRGPTGYALARRAALVDAYRNMAEATRGIRLNAETDVRGMGKEVSDRVVVAVNAVINACSVVDSEESLRANYNTRGDVTLRCRSNLAGSGGVLGALLDVVTPEIKKKMDNEKITTFAPPPTPVATEYDGLIVRVPSQFKPSLYPMIRTDRAEVVYSLKDVPLAIQKNRGLAAYTDDLGKATASLKAMGAQSILTVDASLYLDTEAQVKAEDAAKIANANKKTSFLNSARVVFVIAKSS